ncbi:lipopolysaccharide kinase InaA family protein [Pseudomonas sp. efr-133-TYG-103a]|uniref:lipopolysaccharide kinase InaA family protein n=1 Tax=Pseudomonas sp. efr-133-TYG-103a TaxID=3040308 RepID=UPI002557BC39|nr:lipopolysaccharide kinase InaA family protein [Pseudomonas sp. efr-133-TYG-103a]
MRQREQDFSYWWSTSGPWVEEPNVRRSGTSGVQRVVHDGKTVYVKRQTGHLFRSLKYPLGRPTVMREGRALSRLMQLGVTAPQPIYYGAEKVKGVWHGVLVTKDLNGFQDLDTWYDQGARTQLTQEEHLKVLEKLAVLLSRMHLGRWQHGCMRSKHIFIKALDTERGADFELALLDLEKSHGRASTLRAARHDIPQLRRHSYWSDVEWQYFLSHYEKGLGRPLSLASA